MLPLTAIARLSRRWRERGKALNQRTTFRISEPAREPFHATNGEVYSKRRPAPLSNILHE